MEPISYLLKNGFSPLAVDEAVAKAQNFFIKGDFSHFPVLEDSIFLGCISSEDIDTFDPLKTLSHYRYTFGPFFARTSTNWFDVLSIFAQQDSNICPVLDETNKYVGYYELQDFVALLNETPFIKEAGGIILVEKPVKEYSMSQVAQIVESNNGRLLGLFVSETEGDLVRITVKTTIGAMNDIIQTFRRYNYQIISEHQEDAYLSTLRERSDYLDKYLNL